MMLLILLLGISIPNVLANWDISIEELKNTTGPEKVVVLYNMTLTCNRPKWCVQITMHRIGLVARYPAMLEPIQITPFRCTPEKEITYQAVIELGRNGTAFNTTNEVYTCYISDCGETKKTYSGWQRLPGPGPLEQFATYEYTMDMTKFKLFGQDFTRETRSFIRSSGEEKVETFKLWADGWGIDQSQFYKKSKDNSTAN